MPPLEGRVFLPPEGPEDALDGQATTVHRQGIALLGIVDLSRLPHPLASGLIVFFVPELHDIGPARLPFGPDDRVRPRSAPSGRGPADSLILPRETPASRTADHALGGAGGGGVELPRDAA